MDIHDDGKSVSTIYDSLEDFESVGMNLVRQYNMRTANLNVFEKPAGAQWWGMNADARTVMNKVRDGSPMFLEGLRPKMDQLDTEIQLAPHEVKVRRRKRTRSDYGDTLDMARVYQGQLDTAWERPTSDHKHVPSERYASIFIDCSVSWIVEFDETLWRSAAALKLCDILQQGGRNVEIYSGTTLSEPFMRAAGVPRIFRNGVRCKEYTQPLQPERLATMVSTAFFRTYSFLSVCATRYVPNYHMGVPIQNGLPKQLQDRKNAGELVIRIGNCFDLAGAKFIIEQAKEEIQEKPKDVH